MSYLNRKYPDNCAVEKNVRLHNRVQVVSLGNSVGRKLYGLRKYEPANTRFFERVIQEDWHCLDVGANCGYYSILFATQAPKGRVYAFEPQDSAVALLKKSIAANKLEDRVHLEQRVLGDKIGETTFCITADSGLASIHDTARGQVTRKVSVPMITLDQWVDENHISRIDCIKIDTEGAEYLVLDGGRQTLSHLKARVICIELFSENLEPFGTTIAQVVEFLVSLGYELFVEKEKKYIPYTPELYDRIQDVYCVMPDIKQAIV